MYLDAIEIKCTKLEKNMKKETDRHDPSSAKVKRRKTLFSFTLSEKCPHWKKDIYLH